MATRQPDRRGTSSKDTSPSSPCDPLILGVTRTCLMNTGGHGGVALAKLRGVARITLGGIAGASVSPHVPVIAVSGAVSVFYVDANRYDSNRTKRPRFL